METFDFQGHPIAYVRAGAGEPVVFLHNGGTSHAIWRSQMQRLAQRYEAFALDLLGYGASAKPAEGYDLDTCVDLVAAFVDHHRLAPVVLVGNCMGSAMSLAFAARRPHDVRALVLVNPLTEATLAASRLTGPLYRLNRHLPALGRTVGRIRRLPSWTGTPAISLIVGQDGRAAGVQNDEDLHAAFASSGELRSLAALLADVPTYAALDQLIPGEDFPPVCTIWGVQNRVLSAEAGRRLNATLRPARAEWLEGSGHLPMLEQPEQVSSIIESFLAQQQQSTATATDGRTTPTH